MSDAMKRERERWTTDLRQLLETIDNWAQKRHWSTHWDQKQISESKLGGEYAAPYLIVQSPQGRIHVEPVARYVAGRVTGRVDLLAWPSMRSLMLVRINNQWIVETDSGIRWPQSWGEETFVSIVNDALLSAA
jgi:hypothetical protein